MIIILGGGLSGCLFAFQLSQLIDPPEFRLIEAKSHLGGNHTWSFHDSDLSLDSLVWLKPFITQSWPQQEVRFRDFNRVFMNGYHSIASTQLQSHVQAVLGTRLMLSQAVISVDGNRVNLQGGGILTAKVIIDARGVELNEIEAHATDSCGYQKFLGLDLEFEQPHGLKYPIIMDAQCEQKEGFRFFYLLPWTDRTLLVEDTRYSQDSLMQISEYQQEIENYCSRSQWKIKKIHRRELGVLPIPTVRSRFDQEFDSRIAIGVRGGYFHWTTGYSLPMAVQVSEALAKEICENPQWTVQSLRQRLQRIQLHQAKQSRFFAALNRMMFWGTDPLGMYRVFQRFYKLNEKLIFSFYGGELDWMEKMRILLGKPPVSIIPAVLHAFNFNLFKNVGHKK